MEHPEFVHRCLPALCVVATGPLLGATFVIGDGRPAAASVFFVVVIGFALWRVVAFLTAVFMAPLLWAIGALAAPRARLRDPGRVAGDRFPG